MPRAAVDEYVTTDVLPQQQGIVDALRDLMADCCPAGPRGDPLPRSWHQRGSNVSSPAIAGYGLLEDPK
jgi:hypothetical protein